MPTLEQNIQNELGALCLRLIALKTENDTLREELAMLKAQKAEDDKGE